MIASHTQPGRVPDRQPWWLATPSGGWLGSGADEGRAKLRYAVVRRMDPLTHRSPNGTSCHLAASNGRERGELKHLSSRRKRNQ